MREILLIFFLFLLFSCSDESGSCDENLLIESDSSFVSNNPSSYWGTSLWSKNEANGVVTLDASVNSPSLSLGRAVSISSNSTTPGNSGVLRLTFPVDPGMKLTLSGQMRLAFRQDNLRVKIFRRNRASSALESIDWEVYTFAVTEANSWQNLIVPVDVREQDSEIIFEFSLERINDTRNSRLWLDDFILVKASEEIGVNCIYRQDEPARTDYTSQRVQFSRDGGFSVSNPPRELPPFLFGLYTRTASNPIPERYRVEMKTLHAEYRRHCFDVLMRPGDANSVRAGAEEGLFSGFEVGFYAGLTPEGSTLSPAELDRLRQTRLQAAIDEALGDQSLNPWILFYSYDLDGKFFDNHQLRPGLDTLLESVARQQGAKKRPLLIASPQGGSFRYLNTMDGLIGYERDEPVNSYQMLVQRKLSNMSAPNAMCNIVLDSPGSDLTLRQDQMLRKMYKCALGGVHGITFYTDCAGVETSNAADLCSVGSPRYIGNFFEYDSSTERLRPGRFSGPNGWLDPEFMCNIKPALALVSEISRYGILQVTSMVSSSELRRGIGSYKKGRYFIVNGLKEKKATSHQVCLNEKFLSHKYGKVKLIKKGKCKIGSTFEFKIHPGSFGIFYAGN